MTHRDFETARESLASLIEEYEELERGSDDVKPKPEKKKEPAPQPRAEKEQDKDASTTG